MARPAPGAVRSVAVLELLAANPDERFTLSEVARRCSLNKATAHALLSALTDRGVLLRHPAEKRYSLGPALVTFGDAARRGYSAADFADPVLRRLAAETGQWARLWAVERNRVIELVGAGRPESLPDRPPACLPLVPPVGAVAMAHADTVTVEAWLARAAAADGAAGSASALPGVRSQGFTLARRSGEWSLLTGAGPGEPPGANDPATRDLLRAIADRHLVSGEEVVAATGEVPVADVSAPVFGPTGQVGLIVSLAVDDRRRSGQEVVALAARVVDAADSLTDAGGGLRP